MPPHINSKGNFREVTLRGHAQHSAATRNTTSGTRIREREGIPFRSPAGQGT
jgi:hypothetical protein